MNISDLLSNHFNNNQAALAAVIGVTRQAVNQWADTQPLKSEFVIPVCRHLGWRVTPHQLRADLYPNPGDALPAEQAAA